MASSNKTFHESWYRIANQRICLKSTVKVRRQLFRGQRWYVLTDPINNQFFRLRVPAYEFLVRLNKTKTVEDVWNDTVKRDPDNAPGQEEVIQLLSQLYHANLLHYGLASDSMKLFERYKERKQKIIKTTLMNIAFIRIPLFDPDHFLKRCMPIAKLFLSPFGALLWLFVFFLALKLAIDNFAELGVQSQGILAPSNLFLLYTGLVIVKALHEFGHSFVVRRFGGEVHVMGVMFLLFNPLPYMDATAAWAFRSKWKRVFVGAAGMIVEIFVAACAVFIWANTGPGVLHSLSYNIMFIASVSTILFNINPLLRFDGYYILSDLLDIPNLHTQAAQQLIYWIEKYGFGCKNLQNPNSSRKEMFWLTFFGIFSHIYRVIVFSSILLFVADRFLLAGIIMAIICGITWVITPIVKLVKYLATSPKLERTRIRAISVCVGVFLGILTLLYIIPFFHSFKAPGVCKAFEYNVVVNNTPGYVNKIFAVSGSKVKIGDPLIKLSNKELELKLQDIYARLKEGLAMQRKAMSNSQSDIKPINSFVESIQKQMDRLKQDQEKLIVRAEIEGLWVAPDLEDYIGRFIPRGTQIGQLINNEKFCFFSVVSQKDASWLFLNKIKKAEIKLKGQSGITIPVTKYIKIPMQHTLFPSVALGWGGGDLAIDTKDPTGAVAQEPFYLVKADIGKTDALLLQEVSVKIRFKLPAKPLLKQWWRMFRQMVQKRYQM